MSTLRVDTLQDRLGSGQPAMPGAAKAFVNFNGTGTVAIRRGFNVTSITDNGVGDYTVNFTAAMPDANYTVLGTQGSANSSSTNRAVCVAQASEGGGATLKSTTQVRLLVGLTSLADSAEINAIVFH